MNTFGPFPIMNSSSQHVPTDFDQTSLNFFSIPITVLTGKVSYIEVQNYSGYRLRMQMQNQGEVTIAPQSQAIFPLIAQQQGLQTVSFIPTPYYLNYTFYTADGITPPAANFPLPQVVVNTYEEGETQWYAPFSYTNPINQSLSQWTSMDGAAGFTLSINSSDFGGSVHVFVTGWDLSIGTASAPGANNMTITGLAPGLFGGVSIPKYNYGSIAATAGINQFYAVRYPAPIPNKNNANVSFIVGAAGNADVALTVYYFVN